MEQKQLEISEVQVLRSNAGYYIGRTYVDEEVGGFDLPYDRLSGYYKTRELAEKDLPAYKE